MKNKFRKVFMGIGAFFILASFAANVLLISELIKQPHNISFENANSRDTYFTLHNVRQAQSISKGKGIKVGILDHCFGYELHKDLYSNGVDFLNNPDALNKIDEHGYWMAATLKEIAPECEVYALNTAASSDEDKRITAMINAIDWAIENHIDILTYSQSEISEKNRERFDAAVNKAVKNNIVTTFIHYDNPNNIWPGQMVSSNRMEKGQREPDFNVLHYDYNTLRIDTYKKYQDLKTNLSSGDDIPFFSISSTSPVTAGFIAILKSINNTLTPDEYRKILQDTSYKTTFKDPFTLKESECSRVVDIGKAAAYIKEKY